MHGAASKAADLPRRAPAVPQSPFDENRSSYAQRRYQAVKRDSRLRLAMVRLLGEWLAVADGWPIAPEPVVIDWP
jgi:hypothetical protein